MKTIGEVLLDGLDTEEAARLLEVAPRTWRAYREGLRQIPPHKLREIITAYGLEPYADQIKAGLAARRGK